MNKRIKIPLVIKGEKVSKDGLKLYYKLKDILAKNNLPYIEIINNTYLLNSKKEKIKLEKIKEVLSISSVCIVIESGYENEIVNIVDLYINKGLDVLCFPSSILNPYAFFSNNLIRDGAICVTSEYMLLEYLLS